MQQDRPPVSVHSGLLQPPNGDPFRVSVQVDDGRCRIWTDRRRLGSWDLAEMHTQRTSLVGFSLVLDGLVHSFKPDDPHGFSDGVGDVIDLRDPKSRFGLMDRVRRAQAETS